MDSTAISAASAKYPKPNVTFTYGTAGFRTKGNILSSVVFRMGLLAVLRSHSWKGKRIGVMVTASHNPKEDNGVKLVDPDGEMLAQAWESYATNLANATTEADLLKELTNIVEKEKIDLNNVAHVTIGRDTRPSSPELAEALRSGIAAMKGQITDLGEVTTPQLHFAVRRGNRNLPWDEGTYYKFFAEAFKKSLHGAPADGKREPIYIDGSNGIGAPKAKILAEHLKGVLDIHVINENGPLNDGVGADFVKTRQTFPSGVSQEHDRLKKFAAVDGDADRLIYFYLDEQGVFHMLDGDKIATLAAVYIRSELETVGNELNLHMGVVQTAYANGSSTKYLEKVMKIEVACTPTGVKFLHHRATEFDIGIYFEANGHGTVIFKESAVEQMKKLHEKWEQDSSISSQRKDALNRLINLNDLINQAVGDALSDMLFVEAILRQKNWGLKEWDSLYHDMPNKLLAKKVNDRKIFQTTDAERKLTHPEGLQAKIDALVANYEDGRSFVRPSGTEDVVRIYAEAKTQQQTLELAEKVSSLLS